MTPLQQGILFEELLEPESGNYLGQFVYSLVGELKVPALRKAWQQVTQRHAVLRSLFVWKDKRKPLQIVRRRVDLPWEYADWRGFSDAEKKFKLEEFLAADRRKGFDLSRAPLIRLNLIRMTDDCYELVWSNHHLILDGWSVVSISNETMLVYHAICQGREFAPKSGASYHNYVRWLQRQDLSEAEAFWRNSLKGLTSPTSLAVDKVERELYGQIGDIVDHELEFSAGETGRLKEFCRQQNLTLNTLMQAGWALLLSRYSGEDDVLFGTVVSGRPSDLPGVEDMAGMFVNTLPVRARFAPGDLVSSWLKHFQIQLAEMRRYEHSPLVSIQGWSQVPRGSPLFESLFNFANYPVDSSPLEQGSELQLVAIRSVAKIIFPLAIAIRPRRKLKVQISYDVHRFDAQAIGRMLQHYQRLLEGMVAGPDQRLSDLPLLTDAERRQILIEWNRAERDFPQPSVSMSGSRSRRSTDRMRWQWCSGTNS